MPEATIKKDDTHSTPPTGYSKIYPKTDGAWYSKDDDGTESPIGAGGSVDHGNLLGLSDDDHTQYHNDTRGDARYRTQTELSSTTASSEGASLIGTDTKTNLDDASTVEAALTYLDTISGKADPTKKYRLWDHFIGVDLNWYIWTNSKSAGGNNGLAAIEYRGGAIRITSHGDADEWCELTTAIKSFYAADNPIMRSGQKLEQLSDVSVYIGFRDDYSNKIEFKANTATGYWDCRCSSGGSTTTESSVLALDTDWHHFRIEAGSASVAFYIDDVLEATITTDIPSTIMDVISQSYTTGGTSDRSHLCDYIEVSGDLDY
jgi:hypothetical protein